MPLRDKLLARIAQWNMGCLAIFLLCETLHEVELSSTFRNGLQQLTTPLHNVSPLQQPVSQFYGSFNKGTCTHFSFFVPRSVARQVAEKIAQSNRASAPNLGNLQRYIFNHCETKLLRKSRSVTGPLNDSSIFDLTVLFIKDILEICVSTISKLQNNSTVIYIITKFRILFS